MGTRYCWKTFSSRTTSKWLLSHSHTIGGKLADARLLLVEHPVSDNVKPLDVLVLRHLPELTKAERAALQKVPAEQRAMNVGRGPGPRACSVVILTLAVVAEAAVVAVTYAITGKVHLGHMQHINPGDLKKMGARKIRSCARGKAEKVPR